MKKEKRIPSFVHLHGKYLIKSFDFLPSEYSIELSSSLEIIGDE
jgi:hypothetical protein